MADRDADRYRRHGHRRHHQGGAASELTGESHEPSSRSFDGLSVRHPPIYDLYISFTPLYPGLYGPIQRSGSGWGTFAGSAVTDPGGRRGVACVSGFWARYGPGTP